MICSLWKVDDEATGALMAKFYELWNPKDGRPGLPTAEALRQAQAHLHAAQAHAAQQAIALELLAEEFRLAHDALGQITGRMSADALLGEIFSLFCIGK